MTRISDKAILIDEGYNIPAHQAPCPLEKTLTSGYTRDANTALCMLKSICCNKVPAQRGAILTSMLNTVSHNDFLLSFGAALRQTLKTCDLGTMAKLDKGESGLPHSYWLVPELSQNETLIDETSHQRGVNIGSANTATNRQHKSKLAIYRSLCTLPRAQLISLFKNTPGINQAMAEALFSKSSNSFKFSLGKGGFSSIRLLQKIDTPRPAVVRKLKIRQDARNQQLLSPTAMSLQGVGELVSKADYFRVLNSKHIKSP